MTIKSTPYRKACNVLLSSGDPRLQSKVRGHAIVENDQ